MKTEITEAESHETLDEFLGVPSSQDGIFAELKSAVGNELSKAGLMLFTQLDQGGCA